MLAVPGFIEPGADNLDLFDEFFIQDQHFRIHPFRQLIGARESALAYHRWPCGRGVNLLNFGGGLLLPPMVDLALACAPS